MGNEYYYKWTMTNEIEFINKIGTWRPETRSSVTDLLKGYIKGLKLRSDFMTLDKEKLRRHAVRMLKRYSNQ